MQKCQKDGFSVNKALAQIIEKKIALVHSQASMKVLGDRRIAKRFLMLLSTATNLKPTP